MRAPLLVLPLVLAAHAQAAGAVPSTAFGELHWRSLGPSRGGWSTCVAGIPSAPNVFYFGAAGGGLWRSDDAGLTWEPLFQREATASIGALALAPSDPRVLYVGTGQVDTRYDLASGAGLFRSDDGGKSWRSAGLTDSRAIGAIWIDPQNPDVVLVAAMGHIFGSSPERGVFRTEDGGKSWKRVLFVDPDTGAVDLAADPEAPGTFYAATWQARSYPWLSYFRPEKGPGSGVFKSVDGGRTWVRLRGSGWPQAPLGRIGLATAPHGRVYALVDGREEREPSHDHATSTDGGLYRSDDRGASWKRVAQADWLESSYFGRLTADPQNPDRIFVTGQSVRRSNDGGRTFEIVKGAPGGDDYHFLWINPRLPDHWAVASDQGTTVSVNGGATWSSWYNQPTGQFYRLAADQRFPYRIYSGQQDSGTVAIRSRGDFGGVGWREWYPVGADERDQDIPDPVDPDLVYGAGLGGTLNRYDARSGQSAVISPHLESTYGRRPEPGKYRYTWYTPIAVSSRPPYPLYHGAQVLFRSLDRGASWSVISPDLSRAVAGASGCDGEPTLQAAAACGFGVIQAIALSTKRNEEIWIGTDDGRIQATLDGGKSWVDRTPAGLGPWSNVSSLELSSKEEHVAYAAVDTHRLDDFRPHFYRTRDGGRTWTDISEGLPVRGYASVIRADPDRAGLLYAGTETGVFVSSDDGGHWEALQLNLPTATVTDLLVHGSDLIAATQGRGLWILDDVAPLRQVGGASPGKPRLFAPTDAYRTRLNENHDTPLPQEVPFAANPPEGAVTDYMLPAGVAEPVQLEFLNGRGEPVIRFTSEDRAPALEAERYFTQGWVRPASALSRAPGHHRFIWDLRTARPKAAHYEYAMAASWGEDTPLVPRGTLVMPGKYTVRLTVGGSVLEQPLTIRLDPRVHVSDRALQQQWECSRRAAAGIDASFKEGSESLTRLNERFTAIYQGLQAADVAPTRLLLGELDAAERDLRGLRARMRN